MHHLPTLTRHQLALGLLLGLLASGAAAEKTLDEVDVSGNAGGTSLGSSDAASAGSIDSTQIASQPLPRPAQVLENVPGLVVTQHSGDGKANQYFLRGYNLDHGTDFASHVDGVPVNMPSNAHGQGYTDLNFLIPELIDSIDYRKGPYYADNGDFAAAGSARIHYRDTLDHNLLQASTGSYGYNRLLAANSYSSSGPRLLTALELESDNGPWRTRPENLHKSNALLRLSGGDSGRGWSADGIAYNAHWDATDQIPLALIESGKLGRFDSLDPSDGGASSRGIISGEWHSRDDAGYATVSLYAEHYTLQLWSNFSFYELRPATGDQFEQEEQRNISGGSLVRGWNYSMLGHANTTEIGLQVRHDNIDVGLRDTQQRVPVAAVSQDSIGETAGAAYVQDTTWWSEHFHSLLGLRADCLALGNRASVTPANSGHASASLLSPKLSLVGGPWAKTEVYANAGRGFHSNDARGVLGHVDATTGNAAEPVPALVGANGAEVGFRSEAIPGLQSSLALWLLNSDSELVYVADADIGSTQANAASRRFGVEWNNHWQPQNRNFRLDANLAWTHARYAGLQPNGENGNYIPNAVQAVGLLALTIPHAGAWEIGSVTRYIGAAPLTQDGSLRAPSAIVTHLQASRSVGKQLDFSLALLNVFDRRYNDIAYAQDYRLSPTNAVVPAGITVHPGEPREVRATLAWKY